MNWHYERNGAAVGPVTEQQLQAARAAGEIQPATRVWQQGWPDWRRAADVWPVAPVLSFAPPPPVPAHALSPQRCSECGAAHPDVVLIDGTPICPTCKPIALAKLREGMHLGSSGAFAGPWREGKNLVVARGGPLPDCCVKCGAAATGVLRRTLTWHHPALYALILVSILIYVIVALIVRKTAKLQLPVCSTCASRRRRNLAIGWLSFVLSIACFIAGGSIVDSNERAGAALLISGGVLILFSLIWAVGIQFVLTRKITDRFVYIYKVSKDMLSTLPQFPGE